MLAGLSPSEAGGAPALCLPPASGGFPADVGAPWFVEIPLFSSFVLTWSLRAHVCVRGCVSKCLLFIRTVVTGLGPILFHTLSSQLVISAMTPGSHSEVLGVRTSAYRLRRDTVQPTLGASSQGCCEPISRHLAQHPAQSESC